ncbi:hypothetical protein Ahy_A05g022466 [Arachis hypogaea]|uniref:Uncharacterized protein n=1 Tax=Arachis hypogaea TaxID=3818 RepID=A0A445D0P3_ARAHY|nr:hypothetical protein Ahy_A05g022466 [Arachis hypogaea]
MVREMTVRDGNGRRSHNGVNKSIGAFPHGNMVNPNIAGTKDRDSITITACPKPIMALRIPNKSTGTGNNVMNLDSMDDYIIDVLESDACTLSNVDINSSSINSLVTRHHELLIESNIHAMSKDNPQRSISCDCMAKGTWFWINHVIVSRTSNYVDWTPLSSSSFSSKTLNTIYKFLAIICPIGVTPPTSINVIGCLTCNSCPLTIQVPSYMVVTSYVSVFLRK